MEHESAIVRCPCNKTSGSTTLWSHDRKVIGDDTTVSQQFSVTDTGELHIRFPRRRDSGDYYCVVQDARCPYRMVSYGPVNVLVGGEP